MTKFDDPPRHGLFAIGRATRVVSSDAADMRRRLASAGSPVVGERRPPPSRKLDAMRELPDRARIVIVGGGIAGCSTAYHLAALGEKDVLLLEQGKLTCGTTWHAAGLVGQMRPNRTMTRMSKYGIELYSTLEAETGLATGWKQCGSVNVASTRERMMVLRKQLALARSFGVECEEISPARPASCSRCCAPTTSPARSGSRATARPIPPT